MKTQGRDIGPTRTPRRESKWGWSIPARSRAGYGSRKSYKQRLSAPRVVLAV
jgi:hypothetical protein